jgi:hypothetical protein
MRDFVPELIVIVPGTIADVQRQIVAHLPQNCTSGSDVQSLSGETRATILSDSQ